MTHEFAEYKWGAADMSRVIKMLYDKLGDIEDVLELVLDVLFMDKIFVEFRNQLPPFASYWDLLFKEKQMIVRELLLERMVPSLFTAPRFETACLILNE
jgi:hypothetical protein